MRDIKYKARLSTSNGYAIGIPIKDKLGNWSMSMIGYPNIRHEIIQETISVYTGKKDKNDEEIFEGDIIAIPSAISDRIYKFVVGYNEKDMSFVLYTIYDDDNTIDFVGIYYNTIVNSCEFCPADIEVVGNVFDTIPRLRARDSYEED